MTRGRTDEASGWRWARWGMLVGLLSGCMADIGPGPESTVDNRELFAGEEDDAIASEALITGSYPVGSTLKVTASALNLRSGPSTRYSVITVMPNGVRVTLVRSSPADGWYNIRYGSTEGWSYGAYLDLVSTPGGGGGSGGSTSGGSSGGAADSGGSSRVERIMGRARAGVGFSYWWGHGRWLPEGPSPSTRGSCSGSCPDCVHRGNYGADCSGYVAKAWEVPASNSDLTVDAHPYSTHNFYNEQTHWRRISRDSLRRADALVYRSGGAGHIVLYESGSPWGNMWLYEARGCATGIVRNLRSLSSSYRAIRRNGL
ncbi:MAG: SH3 domain-containing protein [Myxococcota bacterium]|nr:SH3 domain-containing protein [Myxococcota bacterium]MDW8361936.1 SH3 domain-containing protein [Myxococcales bacterium]